MGNYGSSDNGGGFRGSRGSSGGFRGRSEGRGGFRDRNSDDSGRRSYGGGNRDRGERRSFEMHDVVCDKCGKKCKVPFKPTGDKPVFCSECFEKKDNNSRGSSGVSKEQIDEINLKLNKIMKALKIE